MANPKLTDAQVSDILAARLYAQPRPTYRELSLEYGVTLHTISLICQRVARQSVPVPSPPSTETSSQ